MDRRALDNFLVITVVLSLLGNALTPYLREKTFKTESLDCFLCGLFIAEFLSVSWLMIPLQLSMISGAVVLFALPVLYSMSMVLDVEFGQACRWGGGVFFDRWFRDFNCLRAFQRCSSASVALPMEHAQRGLLKLAPRGDNLAIGLLFCFNGAVGCWNSYLESDNA